MVLKWHIAYLASLKRKEVERLEREREEYIRRNMISINMTPARRNVRVRQDLAEIPSSKHVILDSIFKVSVEPQNESKFLTE